MHFPEEHVLDVSGSSKGSRALSSSLDLLRQGHQPLFCSQSSGPQKNGPLRPPQVATGDSLLGEGESEITAEFLWEPDST